ncbi:MAG: hypothetical protein CBD32_02490 [Actinobacteria bacterium TMED172]|nr:hypothetical protein [Cellvibrionales bacterium]OUW33342.1 MAG: hypothetical protein CBD32_02490 [Actinobacteria bacterium TMED172]|tara:strand:- start:6751 stop:7014 length:264 start_codon:yes stop_codon:yes gene_type:complete
MNISPQDEADSATEQKKNNTDEKLPLKHIITSVLAAAIGVQSKKNQEKDFTAKASIVTYILAGIIFTVVFVFTVIAVVKSVLTHTGI